MNYIKFISSTDGAENVFANVSIGYAHCMYYLSSSGLKCKVENKGTNANAKLKTNVCTLVFNFSFWP